MRKPYHIPTKLPDGTVLKAGSHELEDGTFAPVLNCSTGGGVVLIGSYRYRDQAVKRAKDVALKVASSMAPALD